MKTNIVTTLLGRKCHYDRIFCEDWKRTEEESEIVAVMFVPDEEDSEQPKVWVTVKNTDGNLVVVNSTDVYVVDTLTKDNENTLVFDDVYTELGEYSTTDDGAKDAYVYLYDAAQFIIENYTRKV